MVREDSNALEVLVRTESATRTRPAPAHLRCQLVSLDARPRAPYRPTISTDSSVIDEQRLPDVRPSVRRPTDTRGPAAASQISRLRVNSVATTRKSNSERHDATRRHATILRCDSEMLALLLLLLLLLMMMMMMIKSLQQLALTTAAAATARKHATAVPERGCRLIVSTVNNDLHDSDVNSEKGTALYATFATTYLL